MIFLVPNATCWTISLIGLALAFLLCWLEWRRVDVRHFRLRLIATLAALTALTLWGLRPAWRHVSAVGRDHSTEALVWAGGEVQADPGSIRTTLERVPADHQFTLPQGNVPPGEHANPIPDLAYLRRRFPDLAKVDLIGHGLLPSELEALRGVEVSFHPMESVLPAPAITFLNYPSQLELGAPLWVQGSIEGGRRDPSAHLSLTGPDGSVTEASVRPDGSGKKLLFDVRGPAMAATGRFVWRLRLTVPGVQGEEAAEDEFGVSVIEPVLPRLLVLEESPHPDTASLRHWLKRTGVKMTVRTKVGADRYRFASTPGSPGEFTTIDDSLLAGFDLVLADPSTLGALTSAERSSFERAVSGTALGVLVVGLPQGTPPAAEKITGDFSLPGKVVPLERGSEATDAPGRFVRPKWEGQSRVSDVAIPAELAEIQLPDDKAGKLIVDGQGHTVAARVRRGQGQVALTLLGNTWRWNLENDAAAFAEYWSFLFSSIARAQGVTEAGRWVVRDGGGPLFVDEPVELAWTGKAFPIQPAAVTYGKNFQSATELALAQEPGGGPTWTAAFWPREAGWHQVVLPATGASRSFFVSGEGWRPLRDTSRRRATERFAAFSQARLEKPEASVKSLPNQVTQISPVWFFAGFLVSAGLLWTERYAGSRTRPFPRAP